jgi:3-methyladenine DNA glycosylase AlkD
MTHAFQFVLMKYPENIDRLTKWMMHERFAVRRSAPVILIVPARKALLDIDVILSTCDRVIKDEHYLVQKGYGWLLKESVKMYKENIVEYLEKHVNSMSRTAFRYALEKLPKEEKERLMKL